MTNSNVVAVGISGVTGAATGVVTASTVYGCAFAANAVGLFGAAATSSALASLGGGALGSW